MFSTGLALLLWFFHDSLFWCLGMGFFFVLLHAVLIQENAAQLDSFEREKEIDKGTAVVFEGGNSGEGYYNLPVTKGSDNKLEINSIISGSTIETEVDI